MNNRVAVILGPTAVGKSRVGLAVAKRLNAEIISGDSMTVYRGMDIGTAKPSLADRELVPHHLLDVLNPDEQYDVYRFQQEAGAMIREINDRGKLPVIVGGTGLYIQALLENYDFAGRNAKNKKPQEFSYRVYGLNMSREMLYARIGERVDKMLAAGLEAEVRGLLDSGLSPDAASMKSIGYRQMLWYILDGMPYDEAIGKLKQATRNFAKRQFTWYRRMNYIRWLHIREEKDYALAVEDICKDLVIAFNLV